ncbi:MAG: cytochrome c peroxidase, partial [Myxococcota bacterium]
ALVELGRNLFFDQELAGRRNISCASCHHPTLGSADAQSQSRAQGAIGLGPARRANGDEFFQFLPRNALSLWNRGVPDWTVMFWDGRLGGTPEDGFFSPAGDDTPQNFSHALALFSIFPITPDEEMRGFPDQTTDRFGNPNELAALSDTDFVEIWDGVTARIVANDGYDELLAAAFPGTPDSDISIVELGEAMGAFMAEGFVALDTPFDRYLAGDDSAMSAAAKRGALLFYGRANCASCHSGGLLTDLEFHNIAAPQVGTGNQPEAPLDFGRGRVTGLTSDNFKFRTPGLRNIALEAPYFHNGAYATLEDAVRHHLDPAAALANYDDSQVEPELAGTFVDDPDIINTLLYTIDPELGVSGPPLNEGEFEDLMAFLNSLTDPSSTNLGDLIPFSLPSGLSLAD